MAAMPLRHRIAIPVALLVAAAVLGPGWLAVREGSGILTARAEEAQLAALRITAAHLEGALREKVESVEGIARFDSLRKMDVARIDADIQRARLHEKAFTSLIVIDPAGRIVSFVDKTWNVGKSLAARRYFQVARDERRTNFSDSVLTLDKTITVVCATPIVDARGGLAGVLAGTFDVHLENFNRLIQDTRIGASGHAYLVDRKGVVISHPQTARALAQQDFSGHALVREALRGKTGVARGVFEGEEMLASYAPVPSAGWAVVLQQPAAEVLAPAQALTRWILAVSALSIGIAILLAAWLGRRVAAPLEVLGASTERLGRGELGQPIPPLRDDEVGRLGRSLEQMRRSLDESYGALKGANERLRQAHHRLAFVIEGAGVGLWDWELATDEVRYSREWKRQLGYAEHEVADHFDEWGRLTHPDDVEPTLAGVAEFLRDPAGMREFEFRMRHKDGEYRWILSRTVARLGEDGKPLRLLGLHTDVTERKRAEAALREAHERLASIVATAPGIVCSFQLRPDGSTRLPYGGERMAELYGITPRRLAEDASAIFPLVHPDDVAGMNETIAESARTLKPWRYEWRARHPVRGERWLEGHSMPVREPDGGTLWHGVVTDITERKCAEAALRESEARYRDLVENLSDLVCRHDLDGKLRFVNRAALEMLGYEPDDLVGHDMRELLPPELRGGFDAYLAQVRRDGVASGLLRMRTRAGESRVLEYHNVVRTGGDGCQSVLGVAHDVSERLRAEKALLDASARLERLIANLPGVVYRRLNDPAYTTEYISEGCLALTGFPSTDFVSGGRSISEFIDARDAERVRRAVQAAVGARGSYELTYRMRDASGAEKWVWERGRGIFDGKGKLRFLEGFATDVTQSKRAEEERKALFRRVVTVQEDERRRIALELHDDIGQALTAVKLNLQVVGRARSAEARSRALADCLAIADQAAERVRSMALELRPQELDDLGLGPALDWYCARQSRRSGLRIETDIEPTAGTAKGPAAIACYRIAQEAITNVLRHAKARQLRVTLGRHSGRLLLEIADDGAGFDPRQVRGRAAIGLLGMRERAEEAGGTLRIESGPGKGTRVRAQFAGLEA